MSDVQMSTKKSSSGICPPDVIESNLALERVLPMTLKQFKVLKSVIASSLIAAVAGFAILEGAEPTTVGALAITGIGLINGIEWGEWMAAKQAIAEQRSKEE